jgi:hypothetical protein
MQMLNVSSEINDRYSQKRRMYMKSLNLRNFVGTAVAPLVLAIAMTFFLGAVIDNAVNAQMYVYPAKGQSKEQQSKDEYSCHAWAVQQTGFDPTRAQQPKQTQSSGSTGDVVKGSAGGALLGLAVGSLAGEAGAGAAIGAGAGALFGGMRKRDKDKKADAANQQARSQHQAQMNRYNQAKRACLEGKGYSVK